MTVDTRAPRSEVCIGVTVQRPQASGWATSSPRATARSRSTSRASRRLRDAASRVLRTDDGKPREVARVPAERPARIATIWDGRVDGKPLAPGTYLVQAQVRDTAGNVGVTPAELEPGADPGPPGPDRARPHRAAAGAAGDRGRADGVLRRLARRAVPLARAPGRADSACVKRGSATDAERSSSARPRARRASTCSSCAPGAGTRRCRSWSRPSERVERARRRADDHLARHRQGRRLARSTACRTRSPTAARCAGRAMFVGDERAAGRASRTTSRRCSCSSTAADPLRPHERHRSRPHAQPARDRPRGRAVRRLAERWVTRSLGAAAAQVRDRRRQARAVRRRDSLRRGVRLRVRESEDAGTLLARDAADGGRPVRRAVRQAADAAGAPVDARQFEGDPAYGLMEGALDLPGFTQLEESASLGTRQGCWPRSAQPLTPGGGGRRPRRRARTPRELRPALSAVQLGKGIVIRVGLPEWPQRLDDPERRAGDPQHRRHPARRAAADPVRRR